MTVSVSVLSQSVVFYDINGSGFLLKIITPCMYVTLDQVVTVSQAFRARAGMGDLLSIVEVKSNRELDC